MTEVISCVPFCILKGRNLANAQTEVQGFSNKPAEPEYKPWSSWFHNCTPESRVSSVFCFLAVHNMTQFRAECGKSLIDLESFPSPYSLHLKYRLRGLSANGSLGDTIGRL